MNNTYNGWANYETWNVALWIGNDESMYRFCQGWAQHGYKSLSHQLVEMFGQSTPDGVDWQHADLNHAELNEMLTDL